MMESFKKDKDQKIRLSQIMDDESPQGQMLDGEDNSEELRKKIMLKN
jgi:hypothetical protein